jgi:hypothetical protein
VKQPFAHSDCHEEEQAYYRLHHAGVFVKDYDSDQMDQGCHQTERKENLLLHYHHRMNHLALPRLFDIYIVYICVCVCVCIHIYEKYTIVCGSGGK